MGTVLTEGPALLFATSGALLWLEIFRRETVGGRGVAAAMAAGLCMGLAAVSRQYYLALFAAAGCFIVMQWRRGKTNASQRTLASLSLLVGCLPVILLWSIWKGLSSPGMVSGASYSMWKAHVGLNFGRPLICALLSLHVFPATCIRRHVESPGSKPVDCRDSRRHRMLRGGSLCRTGATAGTA